MTRDHFAPLSETQKLRLMRAVELTSAAYGEWLAARAMELGDGYTEKKKSRYHSLRAAFEEVKAVRGLRAGDRVRLFNCPRRVVEGVVVRHQLGAFLTVQWVQGVPPPGAKGEHPHAWQLLLVEPVKDETKEKEQ